MLFLNLSECDLNLMYINQFVVQINENMQMHKLLELKTKNNNIVI